MNKVLVFLLYILAVLLSFGTFSGLLWLACWALGWSFTWRLAIGLYAIFCILNMAFRGNSGKS